MSDQHLIEKPLTSSSIFKGNFIHVYRDTVELPNGHSAEREYIKHPGAVAVLAIDNENNIIMERQFRHPVNKIVYEIPAGKIDPNEDELTCGRRELVEETGYVAQDWTLLGECLPCIGYSSERIVYFLAENLSFTAVNLDEGEFVEVIKQPLDEVFELAFDGKIEDSKSLAGLMLLYGHLRKRNSIA
jgi:ADP-ribose pyrophosphatase